MAVKDLEEAASTASSILNKLLSVSSEDNNSNYNGTGLDTTWSRPGERKASQYSFEGMRGSDNGAAAKKAYKDIYTDEERQNAIDINKAHQQSVQGNWNKAAKDAVVPWHDQNLAKNNPYGNLNNKSFEQTLNLSRQADRFNNHLDWDPGHVGRTTYHLGSTESDTGHAYRRDPIETQEMRQMRANENVDALARQGQAGLQADMNRYGLDLQRQSDTLQAQFGQQLGLGQDAIAHALQSSLITGEYTQPNSMQMQQKLNRFMQELAFEMQTKKGGYIYDVYQKCGPVIASYVSQTINGVPGMSFDELMYSEYMQNALQSIRQAGGTAEDVAKAYNNLKTIYAVGTYAAQMQGLGNGVSGAFDAK